MSSADRSKGVNSRAEGESGPCVGVSSREEGASGESGPCVGVSSREEGASSREEGESIEVGTWYGSGGCGKRNVNILALDPALKSF